MLRLSHGDLIADDQARFRSYCSKPRVGPTNMGWGTDREEPGCKRRRDEEGDRGVPDIAQTGSGYWLRGDLTDEEITLRLTRRVDMHTKYIGLIRQLDICIIIDLLQPANILLRNGSPAHPDRQSRDIAAQPIGSCAAHISSDISIQLLSCMT
jgi:hypothetical protein